MGGAISKQNLSRFIIYSKTIGCQLVVANWWCFFELRVCATFSGVPVLPLVSGLGQ